MTRKTIFSIVLLPAFAALLTSCGKKNEPLTPALPVPSKWEATEMQCSNSEINELLVMIRQANQGKLPQIGIEFMTDKQLTLYMKSSDMAPLSAPSDYSFDEESRELIITAEYNKMKIPVSLGLVSFLQEDRMKIETKITVEQQKMILGTITRINGDTEASKIILLQMSGILQRSIARNEAIDNTTLLKRVTADN